jgi:phosphotransferase system  glucose/maltose/N-acetylglucosamine-specific IIC component
MDFLTSNWFMWVVIVFLFLGYISWQIEALSESGLEWDDVWQLLKKVAGFIFTMIFMPLLIIFGLFNEKKAEKKKDSHN